MNTKGKCLRDSRDRVMVLSGVTLTMMLCFERGCPQCHWRRQLSHARDSGVTSTCQLGKKEKSKTQIMWRVPALLCCLEILKGSSAAAVPPPGTGQAREMPCSLQICGQKRVRTFFSSENHSCPVFSQQREKSFYIIVSVRR